MTRAAAVRRKGAALMLSLAIGAGAVIEAGATEIPGARLERLSFADLPGWAEDDHAAAFATFLRSCDAILAGAPELRPAGATGENLLAACRAARAEPATDARAFFETRFIPHLIATETGRGFLTGYYEPVYDGSREPTAEFSAPLLARPDDLVTIPAGGSLPGVPEGLAAARRVADGYAPYPERAAIEDGALGDRARPIAHLRHPAQAFIIHVQGSARIRLSDGETMRVGYAGRNGHPYASVGRVLVERGHIPADEMSLERLLGWLEAPENAAEAREIMRLNRSFIFFTEIESLAPELGPIGGAGVPLTPGRSLAVDRNIWRYGLPFWLHGDIPDETGVARETARLMIAQDTGSAIVGPARGDFFTGTGDAAGTRAGLIRHRPRVVVLLPRPAGEL